MVAILGTDKPILAAIALFLDVDGTLLEIAARPQAVSVPVGLPQRLRTLSLATGGAVALVSGRTIADLDALFAPLALPSAGLHGFERRDASGVCRRRPAPARAALETAGRTLRRIARAHEGLFMEDKQFALAMHFRAVPELERTVKRAMEDVAASVAGDLELQPGKRVLELRPAGATKAAAVAAFLEEPPFAGRVPIFIGDDLSDETAFDWVNRVEGWSAVVGAARPSAARAWFQNEAAVRDWLAELQAEPAAALQRLAGSESRRGRLRSRA